MNGLSVIIPTLNEERNIKPLIERIHIALSSHRIRYEIIFVDDHSTDSTCKQIRELSKKYPLNLFKKKGSRGKAQSILEGCQYATYDIFAFIDADLQYPPEALADMLKKLKASKSDIVVTNRKLYHTDPIRKAGSRLNRFVFGQLLFGLPYDTQSGMKVFSRRVIEQIDMSPSPWSFDLEFLVRSRQAGFRVESVDITFEKRSAGESKVGFLTVALELIASSIQLKLSTMKLNWISSRRLKTTFSSASES